MKYATAKALRLAWRCLILACMLTSLCRAQSPRLARAHERAKLAEEPQPDITLAPPTEWDLQGRAFSAPAQEVRSTIEPPPSIISLASTPKPRGAILARLPHDSTFEHVPANYHVFAAATAGDDAGVEALTLKFDGATRLTRIQSQNKDFVIESGGTCHEGNSYSRGDSCTLVVWFNPQGPGHRLGFVSVTHTASLTPASFGLTGNGYSPVISITPSQITTVASTVSAGTGLIKSATNMAIDGGDILYVADIGNSKIDEIDSTGVFNTVSPAFATPQSITADSAGILYSTNITGSTYYFSDFTPWGVQTAFGYVYVSTTCTVAAPCGFSTVGMSSPANISIDNSDNLFMLEGTTGSAEMPVKNLGQGTGSLSLWHLKNQFAYASGGPGSFAVDAYGDLYTNYTYSPNNTCVIYEEPLYDSEYNPSATRVAGALKCGFSGDGGQGRAAEISTKIGQMAFDIAGNLYFADSGNQRVRRIDAVTGIISTIAGNGTAGYAGDGSAATNALLSSPTGVAVDSQGQVYILSNAPTAGPTQAIRKVGVTGIWYFGSVSTGTTTPAKVFTIANTGNSAFTLSTAAAIGGVNPTDYAIDPSTTDCVLTAGAVLGAGRSCKIGIVFKPTVAGARIANLLLHGNTVSGTHTILLNGTATTPAVKIGPVLSLSSAPSAAACSDPQFVVTVTGVSGLTPTGQVTLFDGGNPIISGFLRNGSVVLKTGPLGMGTHELSASYSGDIYYLAGVSSAVRDVIAASCRTPIIGHATAPQLSSPAVRKRLDEEQ